MAEGTETMKTTIHTAFDPHYDMSFIFRDVENESGDLVSTEVIGFYFGEPSEELTAFYAGKLKAEY